MNPAKSLLLLLLCLAGPLAAQNRVLELDGDSSYVLIQRFDLNAVLEIVERTADE